MSDRDRDSAGRPRNARPRDDLGRPLPRADGSAPPSDPPALDGPATIDRMYALLTAGRPFHAHEVCEVRWKRCPAEERQLWKALAQMCVGLTHRARGNAAGAQALLVRAGTGLEQCTPTDLVDTQALAAWCVRAADDEALVMPPGLQAGTPDPS